ncbi:hypothetical protein, partial [Cronobacter malonaticus]|uniref:hypothetical protein n=1 Tax=Cronobacter malonaticus TaxID=413503 RepID=UPI0018F86636
TTISCAMFASISEKITTPTIERASSAIKKGKAHQRAEQRTAQQRPGNGAREHRPRADRTG